jgi:hypothetical protein
VHILKQPSLRSNMPHTSAPDQRIKRIVERLILFDGGVLQVVQQNNARPEYVALIHQPRRRRSCCGDRADENGTLFSDRQHAEERSTQDKRPPDGRFELRVDFFQQRRR